MRLTCPNCGADYEVPDGMIPTAGRHVQCTTCHTRWFVRGEARTALTEDQILRRLETWSPRPRPVAVPDPVAPAAPEPEDAAPTAPDPTPELGPAPPPRRSDPAKPAERPVVQQPGPLSPPAPAPRPAPRLALDSETAAPQPAGAAPARSRFGRGVFVALALFLLALTAYRYRDAITMRLPAAGPALETYGTTIDRLRDALEIRFEALRRGDSDR